MQALITHTLLRHYFSAFLSQTNPGEVLLLSLLKTTGFVENIDQQTKKILILEDNQDILEILNDWLTGLGYKVTAYNAISDIIELAKEIKPDLIMLDYLLNDINGGEYCAQLKKHAGTSAIPVIMLSAHQRVIDSLGHYGWDAFVAKPFDLDHLAGLIDTLIKKSNL